MELKAINTILSIHAFIGCLFLLSKHIELVIRPSNRQYSQICIDSLARNESCTRLSAARTKMMMIWVKIVKNNYTNVAILINCTALAFTNRKPSEELWFWYLLVQIQDDSLSYLILMLMHMLMFVPFYCLSTAIDGIIWLEGVFVCILYSLFGEIYTSAHMYLSRLFILFHFNIAIDVIAVAKFVCC